MVKVIQVMVLSVRTIVPMNTFGMVKRVYQLYPKMTKVIEPNIQIFGFNSVVHSVPHSRSGAFLSDHWLHVSNRL